MCSSPSCSGRASFSATVSRPRCAVGHSRFRAFQPPLIGGSHRVGRVQSCRVVLVLFFLFLRFFSPSGGSHRVGRVLFCREILWCSNSGTIQRFWLRPPLASSPSPLLPLFALLPPVWFGSVAPCVCGCVCGYGCVCVCVLVRVCVCVLGVFVCVVCV